MRQSPAASASINRRHALCCGAAAVGGLFTSLLDAAHAAAPRPALAAAARDLVDQALAGLDGTQLWDVHAHLLGTGDAGSGCWVHPHLDSWWHPLEALRKRVILLGAGVDARSGRIDHDYVQRLATLTDDFPAGARWLLFAFEHAHDERGAVQRGHTTFHVPDAWAAHVAQQHAERFGWVASIHPYREDALPRLEQALAHGALAIKWLPSAMNIDLRDARCAPFYARLQRTRTPLIVHVGEEKAVPGAGRDDLGNPLLLRVPLQHGVRVVAAHCASLGSALDIDQRAPTRRPAFELFARLMDETDWRDHLLGDVSALFQVNRSASTWHTVLAREDWHARLLHGSDYPLPCIGVLVQLGPLGASRRARRQRRRRTRSAAQAQPAAVRPGPEAAPALARRAPRRRGLCDPAPLRHGGIGAHWYRYWIPISHWAGTTSLLVAPERARHPHSRPMSNSPRGLA